MISLLFFLIALLQPMAVFAQILPPCNGLYGCGSGPDNPIDDGLAEVAMVLLSIAAGIAWIMISWGALHLMVNDGDEGKIKRGRDMILYSVFGLAFVAGSQMLVGYIVSEDWGVATGNPFFTIPAAIGNRMQLLANPAILLVVLIGAARMVMAEGKSEEFARGRRAILWAIAAGAILNLSHLVLQTVVGFFGA